MPKGAANPPEPRRLPPPGGVRGALRTPQPRSLGTGLRPVDGRRPRDGHHAGSVPAALEAVGSGRRGRSRTRGRGSCGWRATWPRITRKAPSAATGRNRRSCSTVCGPRSRMPVGRVGAAGAVRSTAGGPRRTRPGRPRDTDAARTPWITTRTPSPSGSKSRLRRSTCGCSRARQRLAERLATHGDFTPGEPASETKT